MRWAAFFVLGAACADSQITALVPADVTSVVIVAPAERRAWAFEGGALKLEPDDADLVAIFYHRTLASMGLEPQADGALELARAGAPDEDVWSLPPSAQAVRFDGVVIDPAPLVAATLLPRPPCSVLDNVSTTEIAGTAGLYPQSIASRGAVTVATTTSADGQPPRAYVMRQGVMERLAIDTSTGSSLFAIDSGTAIFLTYFAGDRTAVFEVEGTGLETVVDVREPAGEIVDVAMWPGSRALYTRSRAPAVLRRFELDGGRWATIYSEPPGVQSACSFRGTRQFLDLTGPDAGVVSFARGAPRRFDASGAVDELLTEIEAVGGPSGEIGAIKPCFSAYGRFATGAELVVFANESTDAVFAVWRTSMAWRSIAWPSRSYGAFHGDTRLVMPQGIQGALAIVELDPRRPDLPPRECGRAELSQVTSVSREGDRVLALTQPLLGSIFVVELEVVDEHRL